MKRKAVSPFVFINAVQSSPVNDLGSETLPISDLNRFMLIRGVGAHPETLSIANRANTLTNAPDHVIFDFLHAAIKPKSRRFAKLPRQAKAPKLPEDAETLADIFNITTSDVLEAIEVTQA